MKRRVRIVFLSVLFITGWGFSFGQAHQIPGEILDRDQVWFFSEAWRFHPGHDDGWADPAYDDEDWIEVSTDFPGGAAERMESAGVGWFRYHFDVAPGLLNIPLALSLRRESRGHLEVYLDGERLRLLSDGGDPPFFILNREAGHLLAVRYSLPSDEPYSVRPFWTGFLLILGQPDVMIGMQESEVRILAGSQMFFMGLPLAFGVLHLILFLFLPKSRSNLYYAIMLFLWSAGIFFDYQGEFSEDSAEVLMNLRIHRLLWGMRDVAMLLFFYSVFYRKRPLRFWILSASMAVCTVLAVYQPMGQLKLIIVFSVVIILEIARMVIAGIRRRQEGSWIFAIGVLLLILFGSYDALLDFGLIGEFRGISNGYFLGLVGFFVCMSVHLAREFARSSRKILDQERREKEHEIRQVILEADNLRKTRELEEARELQLSMLPECCPVFPGLEIGAEMRTAAEVGGDYYDFKENGDGSLIVGIGDATGHGTRAGIMVGIMKGLFHSLVGETDIPTFFERCNRILVPMNLQSMLMALQVLEVRGGEVRASSAAMPPILVYRFETRTVEEILIKGMFLGTDLGIPYTQMDFHIAPKDTILLMTDGLMELFNEDEETLELSRIKEEFQRVGGTSLDEIFHHFEKVAGEWSGGRPPDDDMTLLLLRRSEIRKDGSDP